MNSNHRIEITRTTIRWLAVAAFCLGITGCPQAPQSPATRNEQPSPVAPKPAHKPSAPEITFKVASIDLTRGTGFKIERQHIDKLNDLLRADSIDILSIQEVSRYPGVTTRIDIVNELANASGMAQAFGETGTFSGRQTGNAIFSRYPIISQSSTQYTGIKSVNFEAVLQAVIDLGTKQVVMVSTELPANAPRNDIISCMQVLDGFRSYYINDPIIVAGNLPRDDVARQFAQFRGINPQGPAAAPRIWYSPPENIKAVSEKTEQSPLGVMTVAEIGLYKGK